MSTYTLTCKLGAGMNIFCKRNYAAYASRWKLVISTSPKQSKHQLGQQLLKPWC